MSTINIGQKPLYWRKYFLEKVTEEKSRSKEKKTKTTKPEKPNFETVEDKACEKLGENTSNQNQGNK